ncbi:PREDICTED: uncharacterized protein LOC104591969 [Nelumbo nucifera]|uniref:Uncharacterized protein LOC104591969 n=2 Tax=Nelumbo nucifera TaxID=4432 RepID=A0A1U7ZDN7_NELNU|nr:PREDICTED: uncharacterized protein LOC104591969 [Nelumbo nucifera]DAD35952.1 TPA_asm: hypothetical protein HUJ06_006592 [Nelumbo nucifera]
MAYSFHYSSAKNRFHTAIWTVKLGFLLFGIVSTALLLKRAIPYSVNLFISSLPRLWISFQRWLARPYLFVVFNFIIIVIAALSNFQQKLLDKSGSEEAESRPEKQRRKASQGVWLEINEMEEMQVEPDEKRMVFVEKSGESSPGGWSDVSCVTDSDGKSGLNSSASSAIVKRTGTYLKTARNTATESKPLGHPGRVVKATVEKKVRSIGSEAKREENDTLDATWKSIADRRNPTARQLRKSDTWDTPPRVVVGAESESTVTTTGGRQLRKSETFNDTASSASSASSGSDSSRRSGGLRREVLMSHDDLNRRVEAFIEMFRLQRQESYRRYLESETVHRRIY